MLKTGEVFNPSDMTDIETSQKKRIEYIKNNFKMCIRDRYSRESKYYRQGRR